MNHGRKFATNCMKNGKFVFILSLFVVITAIHTENDNKFKFLWRIFACYFFFEVFLFICKALNNLERIWIILNDVDWSEVWSDKINLGGSEILWQLYTKQCDKGERVRKKWTIFNFIYTTYLVTILHRRPVPYPLHHFCFSSAFLNEFEGKKYLIQNNAEFKFLLHTTTVKRPSINQIFPDWI